MLPSLEEARKQVATLNKSDLDFLVRKEPPVCVRRTIEMLHLLLHCCSVNIDAKIDWHTCCILLGRGDLMTSIQNFSSEVFTTLAPPTLSLSLLNPLVPTSLVPSLLLLFPLLAPLPSLLPHRILSQTWASGQSEKRGRRESERERRWSAAASRDPAAAGDRLCFRSSWTSFTWWSSSNQNILVRRT